MTPVTQTITMSARDEASFDPVSFSSIHYPGGFGGPAVIEAWMLIRPLIRPAETAAGHRVGTSCRVCSEALCVARREPSVFAWDDTDGL